MCVQRVNGVCVRCVLWVDAVCVSKPVTGWGGRHTSYGHAWEGAAQLLRARVGGGAAAADAVLASSSLHLPGNNGSLGLGLGPSPAAPQLRSVWNRILPPHPCPATASCCSCPLEPPVSHLHICPCGAELGGGWGAECAHECWVCGGRRYTGVCARMCEGRVQG